MLYHKCTKRFNGYPSGCPCGGVACCSGSDRLPAIRTATMENEKKTKSACACACSGIRGVMDVSRGKMVQYIAPIPHFLAAWQKRLPSLSKRALSPFSDTNVVTFSTDCVFYALPVICCTVSPRTNVVREHCFQATQVHTSPAQYTDRVFLFSV